MTSLTRRWMPGALFLSSSDRYQRLNRCSPYTASQERQQPAEKSLFQADFLVDDQVPAVERQGAEENPPPQSLQAIIFQANAGHRWACQIWMMAGAGGGLTGTPGWGGVGGNLPTWSAAQ